MQSVMIAEIVDRSDMMKWKNITKRVSFAKLIDNAIAMHKNNLEADAHV